MRLITTLIYGVGILSSLSESTPTLSPSYIPTPAPTFGPSPYPSPVPTHVPTHLPTTLPTAAPTVGPTPFPSPVPTPNPTVLPSPAPTSFPSMTPTGAPTHVPSPSPTVGPSISPTQSPTLPPSPRPSGSPTIPPSFIPTHPPTAIPSPAPTNTLVPTTETWAPSLQPTNYPTAVAGQLFAIQNATISVRNPKIDSAITASIDGYPNVNGIAWGNVVGQEKIFWTDEVAGTVSRANFDLSDIEVIMSGLNTPSDIHIGVGSKWMFITGNTKHGITRATVNGTNRKDLITTVPGISGVCHAGPWVYFTTSSQRRLYRVNVDGDQIRSVYDFEADDDGAILGTPMDVAYLPGEYMRPWAGPDQIAKEAFQYGHVYVLTTTGIIRMGPEGTKANQIIYNLTSGYSIDINIAIGKLYFSDEDSGVYQCNLHGGGYEAVFEGKDVRGISLYTSSAAMSYAPSEAPSRVPTPYPTFSYAPSFAPTQVPTQLPTPQPTYIYGTLLFSAGTDPLVNGPFKYVTSTENYVKMNNNENSNVQHMKIMRNEGEETLVVYTDSTLDAVFSVPLVGEAQTLPTLLYKGCNDAGALDIPRGSDYIYVACRTYPLNYSETGEMEIVRINKDGTNATVLLGAGSVGPVSSMSVTDNYIYYTTVKGKLKLISLDGSGLKHLVTNLRDPSDIIISRETYFEGVPVMYVSTMNAIWRISMDGKDITKIVEGLWDCRGIALDLSHGRIYWADYLANGIFSSSLDGTDFRTEVNVHGPSSVLYYTNIMSQKTSLPSATPSETPTPEPTFTRRPTPFPTKSPSEAPTSVPTYYPGRVYIAADGRLYETEVNDGSDDGPTEIFVDEISDCRGITTTSNPPYVYWIDGALNEIYRSEMDSTSKTLIYTLETANEDLYDLSASDDYLFVSGTETNSIIRMDLTGDNAEILVTGIPDCKGLDIDSDSSTVFFVSKEENTVYSINFDGTSLTNLTSNIGTGPNDVVADLTYSTLYIITDEEIWLMSTSGGEMVRLMSGFDTATSAAMQSGWHRLWIADEEGGAIYQAMLNGHDMIERAVLTNPKYIAFYTSSGADSPSPTFSPSTGPSEAPSQAPSPTPTTPEPTGLPSAVPTAIPSYAPTQDPTLIPTSVPSPVPTVTPSFLFYAVGSDTTNGKIMRSFTDGTGVEEFVSGGLPNDLTVESDSKYLFWTDAEAGEIYRTQAGCGGDSGTCGVEVLLSGLTSPASITTSWEGSDDVGGPHVFWTDPVEGKLYRCNLDGTMNYRMLENVVGIQGIAATYQYIYYTMEDENDVYRIDYTCGADDDDCVGTQVLIGVCDRPAQLSYCPQTMLMYCACHDSILNIKTFIPTGEITDRLEIVVDELVGSNYNDVMYNFDSRGLFISVYNQSTLYYMPDILITNSFDDDTLTDDADDKAFSKFESNLTVIASIEYPRSVAIFDSGVIFGDGISLIAQKLLRNPERLFATIDDDGTTTLTDSRVLLSSLESYNTQDAPRKSGSVLTATGATSSQDASSLSNHQAEKGRDLHADFAASAAKADEHASFTPVAAAAGAVAMFAAFAIASRKKRGKSSSQDPNKKKKQRKQSSKASPTDATPASFGPRAGYTSLN